MAIRRAMESNKAHNVTKDLQNKKLYVSNFPKSNQITEEMVQECFQRFGPVDRVLMAFDSQQKKFRGFCYVIMKNQQDFYRILSIQEPVYFFGYKLSIQCSKTVEEVETTRKQNKKKKSNSSQNSRSSQGPQFYRDYSSHEMGRAPGHPVNFSPFDISTSKRFQFRNNKQRSMDQQTMEETLFVMDHHLAQQPQNSVYQRQEPESDSFLSDNSVRGSGSFSPFKDHHLLGSIEANSRHGRAYPRGTSSQPQSYSNFYSRPGQENEAQARLSSRKHQEFDFENEDQEQDLASRHHLIWRPGYRNENSFPRAGIPNLDFIAPSFSQSHHIPPYRNYNIPPVSNRPRIETYHNSYAASLSNYHAGNQGRLRAQVQSNLRSNQGQYSLFGNNSRSNSSSTPDSRNDNSNTIGNNSNSRSREANEIQSTSTELERAHGVETNTTPETPPEGNTI